MLALAREVVPFSLMMLAAVAVNRGLSAAPIEALAMKTVAIIRMQEFDVSNILEG